MKNKLLITSQLILIGLTLASIGTSIAWFNSNDFLQIDSFDFSFKTSDNLLISTSREGTYTNNLTEEDLQVVPTYIPVSSMYSENWINEKQNYPEFKKGYNVNAAELINGEENNAYFLPHEDVASGGYFQQEFYLKAEDDFYATLDLSSESSFINADEVRNYDTARALINNGTRVRDINKVFDSLNQLEKAMRVSLLVDSGDTYKYFIYDPYKNGETLLGGVIDSDISGYYDKKLNPFNNQNYEVLYGEVSNRESLVYSYNEFDDVKTNPTTFTSGHAANTNVIDLDASLSNGVIIKEEKSMSFEESETIRNNITRYNEDYVRDNLALIPLDAGKPTRIVVSIYLEGWDTDCIDDTMGASFNCQLSFGLLDRNII